MVSSEKMTNITINVEPITLSERVNPLKVRYILDNFNKIELGKIFGGENQGAVEAQLTKFERYASNIKRGRVPVTYNQKGTKILRKGRYFAKGSLSLQSLSKTIRHTIAGEYYHDIDMKNAHPVLLLKYCQDNDIPHKELQNLVDHREEVFKESQFDRPQAKTLFLTIINGGLGFGYESPLEDGSVPEVVQRFHDEMEHTRAVIALKNPNIVKRKTKELKKEGRSLDNLGGAVISSVMCDMENQCLLTMKHFFETQDIYPDVLCFDGLMIEKKYFLDKDLLGGDPPRVRKLH
jgi:hypothetical protein